MSIEDDYDAFEMLDEHEEDTVTKEFALELMRLAYQEGVRDAEEGMFEFGEND